MTMRPAKLLLFLAKKRGPISDVKGFPLLTLSLFAYDANPCIKGFGFFKINEIQVPEWNYCNHPIPLAINQEMGMQWSWVRFWVSLREECFNAPNLNMQPVSWIERFHLKQHQKTRLSSDCSVLVNRGSLCILQ